MKKIGFILLGLAIVVATACNKDNNGDGLTVTKTQWGFIINYTATWCGYCGSWGAPLIKDVNDMGNVVAITAHASGDPMHDAGLYNGFSSDRPTGGGIPSFWTGDVKTGQGDSESQMTAILAQPATAAMAMESTTEGTTMTIKVKAEWFEAGTGDYYLSVLVLEDGIDGSSASGNYAQGGVSNPADYKHMFVLRASANGNAYGEMISTDPAAGATVEKEYTVTLDPSWTNTVYPVALLWKHEPGSSPAYKFVNAIK